MRLLILSNRLQVIITENNNTLNVNPSSGGLITGLGAYLDSLTIKDYLWVGWPGSSEYSDPESVKKVLQEKYHSSPVFIEKKVMDLFYNGFCNKTLWPLLHYFHNLTIFDEKMWANYKEVNSLFAESLLKIIQPGDVLWIHDYHFMLAPALIKKRRPEIPIGFFLHVPFPSYEIFRQLPRKWGKEILEGLLNADLVGFHTYDYTQCFLNCVLRILGFNHDMGVLSLDNKLTITNTFPMGIDFEKYHKSIDLKGVKKEKGTIKKGFENLKIIFSVDRQDYTKGILNRLEGYELFLRNYPEWHKKVLLIMIVVPSRIGLDDYQKAKDTINGLIGQINGDYGDMHWTPVVYQYKEIPFEQLIALYNLSDVGLVTPLRDGMNLVAKEYVAAQKDKKGVLILSEFAGASMELGEALIINPNSREEIAEALKRALTMPADEKTNRILSMQDRLKKYDIKKWAEDFISELLKINNDQIGYGTTVLEARELEKLYEKYHSSERKIIFLDYDGTLVPFSKKPSDAIPDKKLMNILGLLSMMPKLKLVLISGRKKMDLENWYGRYNITLVAEHGVWIKEPRMEWKLIRTLDNSWKSKIIQIMQNHRDRLPESFIEEKDYTISWHYRNSDANLSGLRVKEFVDEMIQFTAQNEIVVQMGNKVVDVKCSGVNKGDAARMLLTEYPSDFILAAGDDETDESLFRSLPNGSFTIKIGKKKSYAEYFLNSSQELLMILEKISGYQKTP